MSQASQKTRFGDVWGHWEIIFTVCWQNSIISPMASIRSTFTNEFDQNDRTCCRSSENGWIIASMNRRGNAFMCYDPNLSIMMRQSTSVLNRQIRSHRSSPSSQILCGRKSVKSRSRFDEGVHCLKFER
jgi:hypothetical protein